MKQAKRYSPEFKERAIRFVTDQRKDHSSEWATICSVAHKLGCTPETLRTWVRKAVRERNDRGGMNLDDRARLKAFEREWRELKRANEILRKAAAFFALAELDRRGK